jgi:hypothetical protein
MAHEVPGMRGVYSHVTRWLPGGTHLIVGAGTGPYLVDSATLSARLLFARGHGRNIGSSQDINFTAAIVPLRR